MPAHCCIGNPCRICFPPVEHPALLAIGEAERLRAELAAERERFNLLSQRCAAAEAALARDADRAQGIDPEALEDDAILSAQDIAEFIEQSKRFRGDAAGRSMREIAEHEMVCSRSEYVAMAATMGRLLAELSAMQRQGGAS